MKKTFVIQVEYPDCDFVPSEEVMEVTHECIEHYMERYFGANIMDGDYDRINVKEVTDGFSLVKRMREAQNYWWMILVWFGFIALASILTGSYKTCLVYWLEQVAFGATFTSAFLYSL